MSLPLVRQQLPVAAPAVVLACGAWLKNTACLLDGHSVWMSPLHGDLGTPQARACLLESVARLQQQASAPIEAVAHDLHPDFYSTEVAQRLAQRMRVPAIGVQHHHAHVAQVQAQQAPGELVLGWALDGAGLGADQTSWGGELLLLTDAAYLRLRHLPPLLLPGGDVAAREPWRMAAAALQRLGRTPDAPLHLSLAASARLCAGTRNTVPAASLRVVSSMLQRGLNCPSTTSAGRWFDAVAGLLGICWWQTEEAQAAVALEQLAEDWLAQNPAPLLDEELIASGLHLDVLVQRLLSLMAGLQADAAAYRAMQARAAALFHVALADALARAAIASAQQHQISVVALSGGCFYNRILRSRMQDTIAQAGFSVHLPSDGTFGDAGVALGQAWVAAHTLVATRTLASNEQPSRSPLCV